MAITATLLSATFIGWDNPQLGPTVTVTSASLTPGANCEMIMMLSVISGGTIQFNSTTPTSTGSGPTWTSVEKVNAGSGFQPCSGIWSAPVTSDPGTFTVSCTYGAGTSSDFAIYLVSFYKVTGHDTGTPVGGKEVTVQGNGNGAVTATLDAAPASGDVTLAQCLVDENSTNKVSTFGSSFGTWTTDQDGAASGHQLAYNVGQRTGSTSTSVEWSDVNSGTDNFGSTQAAVVVKVSGSTNGTGTPAAIAVTTAMPAVTASGDQSATATPAAATVTAYPQAATGQGDAPPLAQRSIIRSGLRLA